MRSRALALLVLAIRRPSQPAYLIVSIICIVVGSAYLVRSDVWYLPGVNPYLAITVSVLSAGFFWVAGNKVLEARSIRPTHDLESLVGALGRACFTETRDPPRGMNRKTNPRR